jgi:hypothetical protein
MLLGGWLAAEELAPGGTGADAIWPLLIVAAGVCFLVGYAVGAGPWQLFLGLAATLGGAPLLLFSTGARPWELLPLIWPVFLVAGGIACLAYLAASPEAPWLLLVPGLGAVLSGASGLLFSLGIVSLDPMQQLRLLWPLLLVVTGFLGLMQAVWHSLKSNR